MKRRTFTDEFKRQVAKEAVETGNNSVVGRKYDVNPAVVGRWVRDYGKSPMTVMSEKALSFNGELKKKCNEIKEIEDQNYKLKKLIGEKELEIEILRDLLKKTNVPLPPRSK